MDERKLKEQDTELMKNEINGLNEVYREIANEIGIENARIIHKMFHELRFRSPAACIQRNTRTGQLSGNITARIFLNSLRNMTTPSVQYGGSSKQVIRNERYL